ncbi:hypothetical protein HYU17_06100 [Candidatus Woesearchaeota archaeon]|nr:hypothetical protein [Candidatus Woesearchaeota archaeon]
MNTEQIEINGRGCLVKIHQEHRHNARVSITKNSINIRLPDFMSWDEKARELLKLKLWAVNKLEENPEQFKPEPPKDYKDGDILKVGNEEYTLKIGFKEKESSSAMTTNPTTASCGVCNSLGSGEPAGSSCSEPLRF